MGFFDQTRYIRTFLIILPIGLVFLGLGIKNSITASSGIDGLSNIEGTVIEFYVDNPYEEYCNCNPKSVFLKLNNNKNYLVTRVTEHIEKLEDTLKKGMVINVWPSSDNYIKQLAINEEIIVEYEPSYVYSYLFLFIGLAITVLAITYLFKHPEDLKG